MTVVVCYKRLGGGTPDTGEVESRVYKWTRYTRNDGTKSSIDTFLTGKPTYRKCTGISLVTKVLGELYLTSVKGTRFT